MPEVASAIIPSSTSMVGRFSSQPFMDQGAFGVVTHAASSRLIVQSQGRHRSVPAHGFGSWTFQLGDEVAIGKDVDGTWKAFPAVTTVADLPLQTATVGSLVSIGGVNARIADGPVLQVLEGLAKSRPQEAINYLLVRNLTIGEFRLWGVFRNDRTTT